MRRPPVHDLYRRRIRTYGADVGATYGQFCPVAKAMELLDERWTLLLVRELLSGSERFNDLRRGLPRMSPSLLSRRLQQLERAGVVTRIAAGRDTRYVLTAAGAELRPVVEALGSWGIRWIGELGEEDADPSLLLWDMHRNVDRTAVPRGRTVVHFRFPDAEPSTRDWWLVITAEEIDVCDDDPGYETAVTVTASLPGLVRVWRGDVSWEQAVRAGWLQVDGPAALRRALPGWFTLSVFATVPRDRPVGALPVDPGAVEVVPIGSGTRRLGDRTSQLGARTSQLGARTPQLRARTPRP